MDIRDFLTANPVTFIGWDIGIYRSNLDFTFIVDDEGMLYRGLSVIKKRV